MRALWPIILVPAPIAATLPTPAVPQTPSLPRIALSTPTENPDSTAICVPYQLWNIAAVLLQAKRGKFSPPRTISEFSHSLGQFRTFTTSLLDLRSPDSTGRLVFLLLSFQFSFFFWTKLGLFLLFPSAFISLSLITHIGSSSLKNDLRQLVRLTITVRGAQFIVRSPRPRC